MKAKRTLLIVDRVMHKAAEGKRKDYFCLWIRKIPFKEDISISIST